MCVVLHLQHFLIPFSLFYAMLRVMRDEEHYTLYYRLTDSFLCQILELLSLLITAPCTDVDMYMLLTTSVSAIFILKAL
jgi:hypothetical protein